MNGAVAQATALTIIEWTPDDGIDGTEHIDDFRALLASYHLATEAEKTAHWLSGPARTVDDLPERYRAEVTSPCAAFAGRTVLLAVSDGAAIGCVILSGTAAPGGSCADSSGAASDGDSSSATSSPATSPGTSAAASFDAASGSASVDGAPAALSVDLSRLWVDPTARRTGTGGALVRHALALAEERGAASIRLSVWSWRSDAIALYRRNGFIDVPSWDARPELVCFERRLSMRLPDAPGSLLPPRTIPDIRRRGEGTVHDSDATSSAADPTANIPSAFHADSPYLIREVAESDWPHLRGLRLEMLEDTPIAFGETIDVARTHDDSEWRMRARRGMPPHTILLAAILRDGGRWVGTMGGFVQREPDARGPLLVGVYVSADHRGREHGVAEAMIAEVERWAAEEGDSLRLRVHEDNARAIAFYRRLGYEPNGLRVPYILDRSRDEIELEKRLR